MSRYQQLLTVLFCMFVLFAVAPTGGAFAQCIDLDGDSYGINGDASCSGAGVDCDDTDDTVHPGATKICDGKDNNCDGKKDFTTDEDKDNDGVPWCAGDCDDNNPNRSPNFIEAPIGTPICEDGIDNDCDNRVDSNDQGCQFSCFDSDGDGYGINGDATCTFPGEVDCDDNDDTINPGITDDSCNGIDNNCSGMEDNEYVIDDLCGTGECQVNNTPSSCVDGVETICQPGAPLFEGPAGDATCIGGKDEDCDTLVDLFDPGCNTSCLDQDGDGYGVNGDTSCGFPGQIDCDDSNAATHPGGDDANCNGIDEDCVGGADSGYAVDASCGAGLCNTTNTPSSCVAGVETLCQPGTGVAEDTPGVGVCVDGVDNDCDGLTDTADSEGCSSMDIDDDGDGFTENGGDCNDGDATMYPGAPKLCDGKDNNCDGKKDFTTDEDKDNDGVPWCANDCDDNNASRSPDIPEAVFGSAVCTDGIDNDCDNRIDINDPPCAGACQDFDEDGYGVNGDVSCDFPGEIDCNDNDLTVNPGIIDNSCNGIDNNCSGTADDGYVVDATCGTGECQTNNTPSSCTGGVETVCQPGAPVLEGPQGDATCSGGLDEDCDTLIDGNDPGCQTTCIDQDGDGYGVNGDVSCPNAGVDCDDSNAAAHPGGDDANCNGVDEDCVGGADSGYVVDDGCGTGECQANNTPSSCTGGVETACQAGLPVAEDTPFTGLCIDGLDNDCDGLTDQVSGMEDPDCSAAEIDNDGDGYCAGASCSDGSSPNDCDDTDPNVYPGAIKICDGKDSNCDGKKDFATDEDKDGDGVPWCADDCDDNNDQVYPGNTEGPFGDLTCSDGLDNDCQNGADTSDPACVVSCETKINPKDGPHVETLMAPGPDGLPNTGDDVVHPDNNNLLCGKCHGATLQDPIRYACDRCHAEGGITKAIYPDTFPFGFGSAPDVQVHSSTVVGTKYGAWDLDCVTCHNPHLQEQDEAYGTAYGKLIKEYICLDNPVTGLNIEEIVEFTAASGTGSFADGPPHTENICNMCHTQTNHHQRDGTAPGGQDHNNEVNCTQCHPHIDGFAPTGGEPAFPHDAQPFINNCDYCHVTTTDFSSPIPDEKCEQCHTPTGSLKVQFPQDFATAPDVLTHSDVNGSGKYVYTNRCVDCHNPMFEQSNVKLIRSVIQGSIIPGSIIELTALSGAGSFADGPPHAENICETCHSQTNHHQADGSAPGGQSHFDSATCTSCHFHDDGFLPSGDCLQCHNQSPPAGSSDPNRRQIVEGNPGDGDGDFVKSSRHVTDGTSNQTVTADDCLICHDQSFHTTFGDGESVFLNNQDGGASYPFDGTGSSVEGFCVSCHDSNGSLVNGIEPFSASGDTNSPPDIGWSAGLVSHSTFDVCFNCHAQGHGSEFENILAEDNEPGLCFSCHNAGGPASTDIESKFAMQFGHPVTAVSSSIQCLDCHNPHQAEPGTHTPDGQWYPSSPDANSNLVSGVLSGVMGVEPSPWAAAWRKADNFTVLDTAEKEYQICFKCHARYSHQYSNDCFLCHTQEWINNAIVIGFKFRSAQREFNINNKSAHPVAVTSFNQTGSYAPQGQSIDQMSTPWTNVGSQTMYCSDCHGAMNEDIGDPRGPHGSDTNSMLKGIGQYWPVKPDGTTVWRLNTTDAGNPDLFCKNCHPLYADGSWKNNVHAENNHNNEIFAIGNQSDTGIPCVSCHYVVPHGGQRSRLIAYGDNELSEYITVSGTNFNVIRGFRKEDRFNYTEANCFTMQGFGCHPHETDQGPLIGGYDP